MPDYKLTTIEPDRARPDLTFTKGECKYCPYVTQRGYPGYAESSVKEHLRDKHKIFKPERDYRKEKS